MRAELLALLTYGAESPLRDAGLQDSQEDDLQDEFLGTLAALGGSAGNVRLRDGLEWDVATYDAVKAQLLSRGLIVPGRGSGGSVALAGVRAPWLQWPRMLSASPGARGLHGAPASPQPAASKRPSAPHRRMAMVSWRRMPGSGMTC